ncbi:MAG: hypothetical protein HFJ20_03330 [Clostridia bacterium]|nr:hypothetical protein [Clostridia bacterium]
MPWIAFVNEEVLIELDKINTDNNKVSKFPEHDFILSALKIGLTIQDLKQLTYVDVAKMILCTIDIDNIKQSYQNIRNANQSDIDRLLR